MTMIVTSSPSQEPARPKLSDSAASNATTADPASTPTTSPNKPYQSHLGPFVPLTTSTTSSPSDSSTLSLEQRFPFLLEQTGRRRSRQLLSPSQTNVLLNILRQTRFPSTAVREAAAKELGISPRKVQVFFQNKRQGLKKRRRLEAALGLGELARGGISMDEGPERTEVGGQPQKRQRAMTLASTSVSPADSPEKRAAQPLPAMMRSNATHDANWLFDRQARQSADEMIEEGDESMDLDEDEEEGTSTDKESSGSKDDAEAEIEEPPTPRAVTRPAGTAWPSHQRRSSDLRPSSRHGRMLSQSDAQGVPFSLRAPPVNISPRRRATLTTPTTLQPLPPATALPPFAAPIHPSHVASGTSCLGLSQMGSQLAGTPSVPFTSSTQSQHSNSYLSGVVTQRGHLRSFSLASAPLQPALPYTQSYELATMMPPRGPLHPDVPASSFAAGATQRQRARAQTIHGRTIPSQMTAGLAPPFIDWRNGDQSINASTLDAYSGSSSVVDPTGSWSPTSIFDRTTVATNDEAQRQQKRMLGPSPQCRTFTMLPQQWTLPTPTTTKSTYERAKGPSMSSGRRLAPTLDLSLDVPLTVDQCYVVGARRRRIMVGPTDEGNLTLPPISAPLLKQDEARTEKDAHEKPTRPNLNRTQTTPTPLPSVSELTRTLGLAWSVRSNGRSEDDSAGAVDGMEAKGDSTGPAVRSESLREPVSA
ncbi:hypothetical protein BDZ90DRAFT_73668 [Jaminaea rosea]|uniref:Homeobox domain-containing protein n=1 Tax=Jaminaea rosea TaxID=1569628 RepID=A0A316UN59_9BASI|nr:hypothetical protein BDZ90DRAFT_73668 [Jaminaea rosea]PWN25353.1 hypothetical protein BDZ90DRAFT_73668 [Jaminaea rosea]